MKELDLIEKIEVILFLENDLIDIKELARSLKIDEKKCLLVLDKLNKKYQSSEVVFEIVFNSKQAQLAVKKKFSDFIKKYFHQKKKNEQFSPAMLEVLSIVLYRSPIGKVGIEKIRGVNSDLILRKLSIRGLIDKKEKVKNSGIFIYQPSLKLMRKLGVSELENLPKYDKLSREFDSIKSFI